MRLSSSSLLPLSYSGPRYDCERNQWNHCDQFNFTVNVGNQVWDDDDDDDEVWGGPAPVRYMEDQAEPHNEDQPDHVDQLIDDSLVDQFLDERQPYVDDNEYYEEDDEDEEEDEYVWGGPAPAEFFENQAEPLKKESLLRHFEPADRMVRVPLPEQTEVEPFLDVHLAPHVELDDPIPEKKETLLQHVEPADRMVRDPLPERFEVESFLDVHPSPYVELDDDMVDDPIPEKGVAGACSSDNDHHPPDLETGSDVMDNSLPKPPPFDNQAQLETLRSAQYDVPSEIDNWNNVADFLYKRYGLLPAPGDRDTEKQDIWCLRLGATKGTLRSHVQLHDSFIQGVWPEGICDLSPGLSPWDLLSSRSRDPAVHIISCYPAIDETSTIGGYLVTPVQQPPVGWKLLIKDPLTIVQIEREGWDRDPDGLVVNLVRKGLPFQILNPGKLQAGAFYKNGGPIIHPSGKAPKLTDYLAYRQEVSDFFDLYPHAYIAALSAGGILWRIAVDVLPVPNESDIVCCLHPERCDSVEIDGVEYWTPRLTEQEEDSIVGMYRWTACKPAYCILRNALLTIYSSLSTYQGRQLVAKNSNLG